MKKIIAMLICIAFVITAFAACNKEEEPPEIPDELPETQDSDSEGETDPVEEPNIKLGLDLTGVEPLRYSRLGPGKQYVIAGGDRLSKYDGEPKESFLGVCKYYDSTGYKLYGYNELGPVLSATYTKDKSMMHIYWIGGELNELGIVTSKTGAENLPPQTPEVTDGPNDTVVAQMRALEQNPKTNLNGMGYVVRLADGSFIIYDGGYELRLGELWDTLKTYNGGEEGIVIRAWLLTHAHGDHYPCFNAFADEYADKVKLEYMLISPSGDKTGTSYLDTVQRSVNKFDGAKTILAHTGMVFNFCDVKMEILISADEVYVDAVSDDFNNTSLVSRIIKEGGKSMIFLGDAGDDISTRLVPMYGEYLKSDMCQAAHHGVEDFTVGAYRLIRAAIWFYPCNSSLYGRYDRNGDVRIEIRYAEYTEKIYLHDTRVRSEESFSKS